MSRYDEENRPIVMRSLTTFACALFLAPGLVAQPDYRFSKASPGTLGLPLSFHFFGAPPGKNLVFMMSMNGGPTPLSLISPGDNRVIEVGIESTLLWFALPSKLSGWSFGTPTNSSMHAAAVHFQTLTIPGSPFVVDKISNKVVVQMGSSGNSSMLASKLAVARSFARPISYTQSSGKLSVLLAGGGSGSIISARGLNSTEIYDADTMTIRKGPMLNAHRALGVAVVLRDGRVLLSGGVDNVGGGVSTCEVWDPKTGRFTPTGSMSVARIAHGGCQLPDGTVLVSGGTTTFSNPVLTLANAQNSCEIWNPKTGNWSVTGSMRARRLAHGLDALQTGDSIATGGFEVRPILNFPTPIGSVKTCELYNFATRKWSSAASMKTARAVHLWNNVQLRDGRMIVTGGLISGPLIVNGTPLAAAEIYDPRANSWTSLPNMPAASVLHSATVVPYGNPPLDKLILAGGAVGLPTSPVPIDTVQELDLATLKWRLLPRLKTTRGGHSSVLTPNGLLLLFGGQGGLQGQSLDTVEALRF